MKEGTKFIASDVLFFLLSRRELYCNVYMCVFSARKKKEKKGGKRLAGCRRWSLEREREREREEREEREEGEEGEEVQMLLSSLASPCCVIVSDKLV